MVQIALPLTRRRFTVDEYYRMAEVGILGASERVELIDGEIVEMAAIGPRHAFTVDLIMQQFFAIFGNAVHIRVQNPVHLDVHSEPEPDVAMLLPRGSHYATHHPTPADVLLVVEVADSSLETDRRVKLPLYARAGIPEAWLVDLVQDEVLVHRDPSPNGYRTVHTVERGERLAPLAFPDRELAVADILG